MEVTGFNRSPVVQHQVTTARRTPLITRWRTQRLFAGADDDKKNDGNRPPIMPFDFAREDIVVPPKNQQKKEPEQQKLSKELEKLPSSSKTQFVDDPSRPTGYGNTDEDDDNWVPSSDTTGVEKFMRDYILDSPYDNSKRQDAKFVVRSVIFFSFAIGTIFTLLFYAFPGKFIERRSDVDFSKRYQQTFVDPNGLLNDEFKSSGGELFDDAVPPPKDDGRVPYEDTKERRAPGRSVTL
jgi:hypothetical protein